MERKEGVMEYSWLLSNTRLLLATLNSPHFLFLLLIGINLSINTENTYNYIANHVSEWSQFMENNHQSVEYADLYSEFCKTYIFFSAQCDILIKSKIFFLKFDGTKRDTIPTSPK